MRLPLNVQAMIENVYHLKRLRMKKPEPTEKRPKRTLTVAKLEEWIRNARYVYSGPVGSKASELEQKGANGCLNYIEALMERDGYREA